MRYKIFLFLFALVLNSCVTAPVEKKDISEEDKKRGNLIEGIILKNLN